MIPAATNEKANIPYPLLTKYLAAIIWTPSPANFEKISAINSHAEFFTKRIAALFFSGIIYLQFDFWRKSEDIQQMCSQYTSKGNH